MARQSKVRRLLASAIGATAIIGSATPLWAQSASFDCKKAAAPDEIAICSNPELAGLDSLVSVGYRHLQRRLGAKMANRIHLPFLRARRACKSNSFCIFERQIAEIPSFRVLGAKIEPPAWLTTTNHAGYDELKKMLNVGECSVATISEISYRLCMPDDGNVCIPAADSGSSVALSNGIYGVSYDKVEQVHHSSVGDPVIACLSDVPKDCPPGDDRGYVWSVTNLRTGESWELPDAQHRCGGA